MIKTTDDIYAALKEGTGIHDKVQYSNPKTGGRAIRMSLGRVWLNTILPDDYPLMNEVVNKSRLGAILKDLLERYGPEKAADLAAKINKEAFRLSTVSPSSLSLDVLVIPEELEKEKAGIKKKAKSMTPGEFQKKTDEITKKLVEHLKSKDYRIHNVLEGKIKGDPIGDWKMLLIAKGYSVDIEGNILGPIPNGLSDGLSKDDFFVAAAEARRNFYMKSQMSWQPGYLARTINMANANIQITQNDCGTQHFLELKVDKNVAERMVGRYYKAGRGLSLVEDPKDIIGRTLKFRSPMYCITKNGHCELCYGKLAERIDTKKVGLLAGGAINKVGINAMMKMKHKSSQVSVISVDFPKVLSKSPVNVSELKAFIDISANEIKAKEAVQVVIDKHDYDEGDLIDAGEYFIIPGIIDIIVESAPNVTNITLPFNFDVQLNKPNDTEEDGRITYLRYTPGERIIYQKEYVEDVNPGLITRLFQGGAKYITQPESLLDVIGANFGSIDSVHIELIVANMFRDAKDNTMPARLNNYRNPIVLGQRKQPFVDSWLNALAFENVGKAIQTGLVNNKPAVLNPIENIILEKFRGPDQNPL